MEAGNHLLWSEGLSCDFWPAARFLAALMGEVMVAERDGVTHEKMAEILRDLAKDLEDFSGESPRKSPTT
jgi:hypothetical protein